MSDDKLIQKYCDYLLRETSGKLSLSLVFDILQINDGADLPVGFIKKEYTIEEKIFQLKSIFNDIKKYLLKNNRNIKIISFEVYNRKPKLIKILADDSL